jgi:hypothetical protein
MFVLALMPPVSAFADKDPVLNPLGVTVLFPENNRVVFEYDRAGAISAITIHLASTTYIVPADICAKFATVRLEKARLAGPAVVWHQASPQIFYLKLVGTEGGGQGRYVDVSLAFRDGQFSDALVTGPTGETSTWVSSSR